MWSKLIFWAFFWAIVLSINAIRDGVSLSPADAASALVAVVMAVTLLFWDWDDL